MCYGHSDVDVADTFAQEAEVLVEKIKDEYFDAVFTSPLQRCTKLAEYCGYPEAFREDRLKELNFGRWEGQFWQDINDPDFLTWRANWMDFPAGGAESFLQQYTRVADFLDELNTQRYRNVCIFAHEGSIRSAQIYSGNTSFNRAFDYMVNYGSVNVIEI